MIKVFDTMNKLGYYAKKAKTTILMPINTFIAAVTIFSIIPANEVKAQDNFKIPIWK